MYMCLLQLSVHVHVHVFMAHCVCSIRILVHVCLHSFLPDPPEKTRHLFSEIALNSLLQLLKKEVAENSRHLNQYFQVFLNYANRGVAEVRDVGEYVVPSPPLLLCTAYSLFSYITNMHVKEGKYTCKDY